MEMIKSKLQDLDALESKAGSSRGQGGKARASGKRAAAEEGEGSEQGGQRWVYQLIKQAENNTSVLRRVVNCSILVERLVELGRKVSNGGSVVRIPRVYEDYFINISTHLHDGDDLDLSHMEADPDADSTREVGHAHQSSRPPQQTTHRLTNPSSH